MEFNYSLIILLVIALKLVSSLSTTTPEPIAGPSRVQSNYDDATTNDLSDGDALFMDQLAHASTQCTTQQPEDRYFSRQLSSHETRAILLKVVEPVDTPRARGRSTPQDEQARNVIEYLSQCEYSPE